MGYSNDNLSYVSLCFVHFLSSFIYNDNYSISSKKQNLDQINSSIIYMQNNLDKTLPIGKIAQSVNLSPSHFSYLFLKKSEKQVSKINFNEHRGGSVESISFYPESNGDVFVTTGGGSLAILDKRTGSNYITAIIIENIFINNPI